MHAFQPMGDQAVLARCGDEAQALHFAAQVRHARFPWVIDVVQAYTSVAVFYDLLQIDYPTALTDLQSLDATALAPLAEEEGRRVLIPCCYALGPDLERVAAGAGLSPEEVVRLHSGTEYTVYAIGFCPGFPYLGYLPGPLCGLPRLPAPRLRVEEGSVGLTGRQTGIYTEARPGGWNLVGRTPLQLVDVAAGYFPLRTGDRVRFEPIDEPTFHRQRGRRL
jgi:inhibitor of KinA